MIVFILGLSHSNTYVLTFKFDSIDISKSIFQPEKPISELGLWEKHS